MAKVVLISKGMSESGESKFRTICLLNVLGKLYEDLMRYRLERKLDEKGCLSKHQFEFRKKRSTVDVIEVYRKSEGKRVSNWRR